MRKKLAAGNWKMNGSREAIAQFAEQWAVPMSEALQVAVAVPHPYLQLLAESLPQLGLAAQDCAPEAKGAHTGQVSAGMLVDWGCQFVIIGHSERRSAQGETDALIAEVTKADEDILIARGGFHGLGNVRYKSSTNRAPRKTSNGTPGESFNLRLELRLIADVGLLGLPNAGKSTLISVVSEAKPKIADYPFTTLVPNLGVVRIDYNRSFVIADVPGLIEGASEGAGLGIQFLKHLSRTRVLLHLVDVAPADGSDPLENFKTIEREVAQYSPAIAQKPRWLVLSKSDLVSGDVLAELQARLLSESSLVEKCYAISAVTQTGLQPLLHGLGDHFASLDEARKQAEESLDKAAGQDAHNYSKMLRDARLRRRQGQDDEEDLEPDDFDDGSDVVVHYEP